MLFFTWITPGRTLCPAFRLTESDSPMSSFVHHLVYEAFMEMFKGMNRHWRKVSKRSISCRLVDRDHGVLIQHWKRWPPLILAEADSFWYWHKPLLHGADWKKDVYFSSKDIMLINVLIESAIDTFLGAFVTAVCMFVVYRAGRPCFALFWGRLCFPKHKA